MSRRPYHTITPIRHLPPKESPTERFGMKFLLCIVAPPIAVLMSGKPGQAVLNLVLTCCIWVPGMIHAFFVVSSSASDKRTDRIIKAQRDIALAQMAHR